MEILNLIIRSKETNEIIWSYLTSDNEFKILGEDIITGNIENNPYLKKINDDLKDYIFEVKR